MDRNICLMLDCEFISIFRLWISVTVIWCPVTKFVPIFGVYYLLDNEIPSTIARNFSFVCTLSVSQAVKYSSYHTNVPPGPKSPMFSIHSTNSTLVVAMAPLLHCHSSQTNPNTTSERKKSSSHIPPSHHRRHLPRIGSTNTVME